MSKENDIKKVKDMIVGDRVTVDSSGGVVYLTDKGYMTYSIPMYGGPEIYEGLFGEPEEVVEVIHSWT